jgi:hypothetical protein
MPYLIKQHTFFPLFCLMNPTLYTIGVKFELIFKSFTFLHAVSTILNLINSKRSQNIFLKINSYGKLSTAFTKSYCITVFALFLKGYSHENLLYFYWYHWKAKNILHLFYLSHF